MEQHQKRVTELSEQVSQFYEQKKPFKIYHGSTNSTRIQVFKRSEMLDTSDLNHVLKIDVENKTALVEPNVPMDKLVRATLKHGLIPPVVMEFPGITVGGGIQGGAGESSSFKFGGFHDTCNSYEMITGDGSVITCNPKKHADLFYGTAGSYGTLGVMTAVELRLIPAKKYVRLTYFPVKSFDAAVERIQTEVANKPDYIDGIMFSRDHGVIMVGTLTNEKSGRLTRFSRAHDEWFYLDAEKESHGGVWNKTIPLTDYLFRYDRGGFWVGKYAFTLLDMPFTKHWRFIHDKLLHARKMYEALQVSGMSQKYIVQDVAIPVENTVPFMRYIDEAFGIFPLWLCPLSLSDNSPFINRNLSSTTVMNIGIWGGYYDTYSEFVAANQQLEQKVTEYGGAKWLYAHAYYEEKEFWRLYGKPGYEVLRGTYHTEYLPTVYDKVRVKEHHPIQVKKGVMDALLGKAKLKIIP